MTTVTASASDRHHAMDAFVATVMLGFTLSWSVHQVAMKLADVGFNPMFSVFHARRWRHCSSFCGVAASLAKSQTHTI
ncbi:hypothetical protein [uncultured Nitratireductor sp.]|uniref:hypothetical protein n=1 Tax=uncultured Nitratireductor sp. TaxID=520953 RepID=UPI0025DB2FDE|nr:hypothetical protein [uncultured Nitratireductor sp.]